MSQNQGVSSQSWYSPARLWRAVFSPDPYAAEVKAIDRRQRRLSKISRGTLSPQRKVNRTSKTPVQKPTKARKTTLAKRRITFQKERASAGRRWFGRWLSRVASWSRHLAPDLDLPVHFVASHLQLDANLSVAERIIRATGMTLYAKSRQIVTTLLIATLATYLL